MAEYVDYGNSASPKTPEEAFFASEETEAAPVESEVFCRNGGVKRIFTMSQFVSTVKIEQQQTYEKIFTKDFDIYVAYFQTI
ncbi:hypothetical protein [Virgibacillus sp. DJP39]|uniref:hypothetical protein n=1 Tax=Virgibacillus sp. DJP39 TaxID=3409790 RepID=UPI003BB72113